MLIVPCILLLCCAGKYLKYTTQFVHSCKRGKLQNIDCPHFVCSATCRVTFASVSRMLYNNSQCTSPSTEYCLKRGHTSFWCWMHRTMVLNFNKSTPIYCNMNLPFPLNIEKFTMKQRRRYHRWWQFLATSYQITHRPLMCYTCWFDFTVFRISTSQIFKRLSLSKLSIIRFHLLLLRNSY